MVRSCNFRDTYRGSAIDNQAFALWIKLRSGEISKKDVPPELEKEIEQIELWEADAEAEVKIRRTKLERAFGNIFPWSKP